MNKMLSPSNIALLFIVPLAIITTGCQTITYPPQAPKIASGFHSNIGVNGKPRAKTHQGIDIKGKNGQEIIAVADGTVLEATVEKCWGPTIAVDHGNGKDGKKIIALYGHVDEMLVAKGDKVTRGSLIARLGNNYNRYKCIAGVRHLHFQIGRLYRNESSKGSAWGWGYFLIDGNRGVNPHSYWADGPNKVTCYEKDRKYAPGTLTYPLPCV